MSSHSFCAYREKLLANNESERTWKEAMVDELSYYPGIFYTQGGKQSYM
jgi:hypothetical protein